MTMASSPSIRARMLVTLNSSPTKISFEKQQNFLSFLTPNCFSRYGSLYLLENIDQNFMNLMSVFYVVGLVKMAELVALHLNK